MRKKVGIILGIMVLFLVVPPIVQFWVSTPSPLGFISREKQEVWISFYAALISGTLTLIGVRWTIRYTDNMRKEDTRIHEQEQKIEFEKRILETKINLAAQYKPILTVAFDSDYSVIKYGASRYDGFYVNNILSLTDKVEIQQNEKRINVSLFLLNIGRGEARNIRISSSILCPYGSEWKTEIREYTEIYTSNGLNLTFFKMLTHDEWEFYNNNVLKEPLNIYIKIEYEDLVGFRHVLDCLVSVQRFIYFREEENKIHKNILTLNPDDTIIQNVTSTVE